MIIVDDLDTGFAHISAAENIKLGTRLSVMDKQGRVGVGVVCLGNTATFGPDIYK